MRGMPGPLKAAAAFIMIFIMAAEMPLYCLASEKLTNDKIREDEAAKEEAEKEKNALKSGLTDIKAILNDLESAKSNLEDYIVELDSDLDSINSNIDAINERIRKKEAEIEITEKALKEAKEVEEKQYLTMKKRVRFMYEKGNPSYIEMLLTADSFAEFLNLAHFISKLSEYDKAMLDSYIEAKEAVEAREAALVMEEEELSRAKDDLVSEQDAMETLIADKETQIGIYETDIGNKEAAVAAYEAEIAAQDAMIKELEAAILAEKKRLLEENRKAIVYDGGKFAWPAPDYTRISDEYGMRMHPTLGIEKFHNGLDLAAPSGSPILAAYDGEVIAAGYSSSMGNYAMIDHGDGLITIYMHASAISASQGQMVARGERIGSVGSTGRSTGPHLHFGVRLNGEYVSPWNYLG